MFNPISSHKECAKVGGWAQHLFSADGRCAETLLLSGTTRGDHVTGGRTTLEGENELQR